ncbi:MAG: Bax inhibitor-1/YccA family protein [Clostridia bacterium]|nr:Bax inhibitor-1/YccA family protein [Clostridia bacterium]
MYNNDAYSSQGNAGTQAGLNTYIAKVFGTMFLGLLVTAVAAVFTATNESMMEVIFGGNLFFVLIIAELGLVIALTAGIRKMSYGVTQLMFYLYAIVNGITLASVFYVYELGTIGLAFFTASASFGIMAVYGAITKKDLTKIGNMLLMGLIGILVASLINLFMGNEMLDLLISFAAVAIFVGLVAYDTQKIKSNYYMSSGDYQMQRKIAVMSALSLYLDFINIFLYLLRIFASKKD